MENYSETMLDSIVEKYGKNPTHLLAMLQDIQDNLNYLPKQYIEQLSEKLNIPLSRIYRMATFFKALSLKPRGRHVCTICVGTTCHVRGAPRLIEKIERDYNIKPGETTSEMTLTMETVGCVGACALGPLVIIDGKYHGNMNTEKLGRVLKKSLTD